jgi:AcrR family transcriptional regulator
MPTAFDQANRRQRLLQSAAALFSRWGFDKTSMDEIARETGISKGAVYLEFPNKDALFKAVLHQELARYAEDCLSRFEQDDASWNFARLVEHSLAAVAANPFIKALMMRDQRIFGSFLWRDKELFGMAIAMRAELFSLLQQAGTVRDDIPAATLAYIVSVTGYGLIAGDELVPEERKVPFEAAIRAWGLLLEGALTPARNPPGARSRKATRALLISMFQRFKTALLSLDQSGVEENGSR